MKEKPNQQVAQVKKKSALRNTIFIVATVILLPIANYFQGMGIEYISYGFYDRYGVYIEQTYHKIFSSFCLANLDKSYYFVLANIAWVLFAILNLLLVKLIYRKHKLQKQVFKVTLISHCVKLGLFLLMWGGSVVIHLIFPTAYFVIGIIKTQFQPGYYGFSEFNTLLDIAFIISLTWGILHIYKTPIKHSIIKKLGGQVS